MNSNEIMKAANTRTSAPSSAPTRSLPPVKDKRQRAHSPPPTQPMHDERASRVQMAPQFPRAPSPARRAYRRRPIMEFERRSQASLDLPTVRIKSLRQETELAQPPRRKKVTLILDQQPNANVALKTGPLLWQPPQPPESIPRSGQPALPSPQHLDSASPIAGLQPRDTHPFGRTPVVTRVESEGFSREVAPSLTISANDTMISAAKNVCKVFSRYVEMGGRDNWNKAVELVEEQMDVARLAACEATQIPAMLIAADIYWRKTDGEWPDWVKIAEYEAEDIQHHPWYPRITYQLYPYDLDEDICTPYWRAKRGSPTPTSVNPDALEEGLLENSEGDLNIEMDVENDGEEGASEDVVTRQKRISLGKRKAVEEPAPTPSTRRSARLSRTRANNPIPPQPPNACSTCVEFGVTCVIRKNAACEPCCSRKKRCEHSQGLGRGRRASRPTTHSRQTARSPPAVKRGRHPSVASTQSEHSTSAWRSPPPPAKRQCRALKQPSNPAAREPITVKIPALARCSIPAGTPSSHGLASAGAQSSNIHGVAPPRQNTLPPKLATPTPTSTAAPRPRTPNAAPGACYTLRGEPFVSRRENEMLEARQLGAETNLEVLLHLMTSLRSKLEAIPLHLAGLPSGEQSPPSPLLTRLPRVLPLSPSPAPIVQRTWTHPAPENTP